MRIVSLNVWHAKLLNPLTSYLETIAPTTDVFCFQEADAKTRAQLRELLTNFSEYTADKYLGEHEDFCLATYVKDPVAVTSRVVLLEHDTTTGLGLHTELTAGDATISLCNFHGISYHAVDDKLDTPGRVLQTRTILDFYRTAQHPVVVTGDFNMLPQAPSIKAFETAGYQNLIRDYKVQTTRNHYAWDRYPESKQYYADFAFVSPDLTPEAFTIPTDLVSDHQPMAIDLPVRIPATTR